MSIYEYIICIYIWKYIHMDIEIYFAWNPNDPLFRRFRRIRWGVSVNQNRGTKIWGDDYLNYIENLQFVLHKLHKWRIEKLWCPKRWMFLVLFEPSAEDWSQCRDPSWRKNMPCWECPMNRSWTTMSWSADWSRLDMGYMVGWSHKIIHWYDDNG